MAGRFLIVNADDFGLSAGVNRGIIEAHERGIVTSASLMVRWPCAAEAAAYARQHPRLSVGLHLDFGEWTFRDGAWTNVYQVIPTDDPDAVKKETRRQLAAFRELMGRKPSHLDSHQHVHREQPARAILRRLASKRGVPVRHFTPGIRHCGDFYGQTSEGRPFPQGIQVRRLIEIMAALPEGFTELGCHPGLDGDVDSMYCLERAEEVKSLCDPRVRQALVEAGVELRSFHDWQSEQVAEAIV